MNNPIGIFYTYYPFEGQVDWAGCIRRAAVAGADSIEISSMRLVREPESTRRMILQTAAEAGIRLSFTTGLPDGCDTSSEDPQERRRGVDFIAENIRLVREMGGHTVGGVFHGRNYPQSTGRYALKERRLEHAAQALREAGRIAADYGVILADEAVNRFESDMINTVGEELDFLARVDSPNVMALLDTFHMNIEEDDLPAAIRSAAGRIGHVHLAENNRKLPGNGHLDWPAIMSALQEAGYDGFLTMESFTTPYPPISDSMCIWRDMHSDTLDEDVRRAVALLRRARND